MVLFDGGCQLCNASVQLLARLDRAQRLDYASQHSPRGLELLDQCGLDVRSLNSVVLVDAAADYFLGADAVLRALSLLGPGWRVVAQALRLVPRGWRDGLYDAIAQRRYRWLGRHTACPISQGED